MFEDLETSIKLFKEGKQTDSGFEYVFNCEEVRFNDDSYEFDVNGDIESQLKEINEWSEVQIIQNHKRPFDEFTQTICPAYPKGQYDVQ